MPVTPPAPSDKDDDTVVYDSGPAQYIDKDHRWLMTGGVQFRQGDAYLETKSALVNLDQDMKAHDAKSLAPVHLWNAQDDLTGTNGFIDFSTHIATVKKNVTLIAKPDTDPGQAKSSVRRQFKEPATVLCDEVVYNYRKRTGHIPGPLTVHQKDRTLTADSADYDGYRKEVVLHGHVHATLKDGSVIDAPEVQIGIEEGHEWIYLPNRIHGVLSTKKDKDENSNATPTPAPPPALPPIPEAPESSGAGNTSALVTTGTPASTSGSASSESSKTAPNH
jgi:lipopolysaccharide export system protein LptA